LYNLHIPPTSYLFLLTNMCVRPTSFLWNLHFLSPPTPLLFVIEVLELPRTTHFVKKHRLDIYLFPSIPHACLLMYSTYISGLYLPTYVRTIRLIQKIIS
jgi:hypothetical protein